MSNDIPSQKAEVEKQLRELGVDLQFPVAKDVTTGIAADHLSEPEVLFVVEYLTDKNAERAYSVVYGTPLASSSGPALALLNKPDIQRIVSEIYDRIGRALVITEDAVVAKLWEIANSTKSKPGEQIKALEVIAKVKNLIKSVKPGETESGGGFSVNIQVNNGDTTQKPMKPVVEFGKVV